MSRPDGAGWWSECRRSPPADRTSRVRPSENRTSTRSLSSWISLTMTPRRTCTPARSTAPSRISCNCNAGQRAKRRHPVIAEQELVLDDQPAAGIEQIHAVIAEAGRQDFVEDAERVVDAQRVGGLAESYSGNVESRPPLDQHDFDTAPRKCCGRRQPADAAADHQHPSNVAHDLPFRPVTRGILQDQFELRAAAMLLSAPHGSALSCGPIDRRIPATLLARQEAIE